MVVLKRVVFFNDLPDLPLGNIIQLKQVAIKHHDPECFKILVNLGSVRDTVLEQKQIIQFYKELTTKKLVS